MKRRIGIAAVLAAALATPLVATGPASAGAIIGCTSGDCSISLSRLVKVHGDTGHAGGHKLPITVQPPCQWNPIGDATTGSQAIIQEWQPNPPSIYGIDKSYAQAQRLVKHPKPGVWYILPVNPNASAAGKAECLKLPLYVFVPPGSTPPAPPIPTRDVAEYAYNHMLIPKPAIQISPDGKGYVNLATFVWGNWPASMLTQSQTSYEVFATVQGGPTVWVLATETSFTVNATGHSRTYGCGLTGSRYRPVGTAPASAGAGTAPDCGVLWQGPDANSTVSAKTTWRVIYGTGKTVDPAHSKFLTTVTLNGPAHNVPVSEIQSINGG